jgi:hypothetical protein
MKDAVKWDQCFDLPNNGLKAYFGLVRKGSPEIIYADFAGIESEGQAQALVEEWFARLSDLDKTMHPLYEFEKDLAAKVGPLSVRASLEERIPDIDHYYEDILSPADPVLQRAIELTVQEFTQLRGMKIRSQKKTLEAMRKSTNSGSPYYTKRRDVMTKTVPVHHLSPNEYRYSLPTGEWQYCAILGWRGQEGGPSESDVKQRVVWMFPFGINVRELQCYQPLIEQCQKFDLVAPWISMEAVDRRVTKLFDSKGRDDLVICTDFTKFDQHFNGVCQQGAKSILEALLSPDAPENAWLEDVFPVKYNIPLAYDWEKIRLGQHGMGSGSGGTNADETLLHRALQHEAAYLSGAVLNPNSMCLGDDGILSFPGITVDKVLKAYTSHGLEMNESKQYVSTDDCVFLRRWHGANYRINGECVGVYSTCRALGRLIYRERRYKEWDDKMDTLRKLSILENVKYHPLADDFAAFVMQRDPLHLGKDIPGFLDNIETVAQDYMDRINDFMSYTQTMQSDNGIADWWIVNWVKSH